MAAAIASECTHIKVLKGTFFSGNKVVLHHTHISTRKGTINHKPFRKLASIFLFFSLSSLIRWSPLAKKRILNKLKTPISLTVCVYDSMMTFMYVPNYGQIFFFFNFSSFLSFVWINVDTFCLVFRGWLTSIIYTFEFGASVLYAEMPRSCHIAWVYQHAFCMHITFYGIA